jgi:D-alanyl-D-alanine carboxypeptidase/D-alanyl-D-alanine-endopeptidase (penicillin-binding protein 4)
MKKVCLIIYLFIPEFLFSQDIATQLSLSIKKLESDDQFKHAIISLYVADGKTGKVVFDKNGAKGLAPASCQKIIISASAFDLLGANFRFKTYLTFDLPVKNNVLQGNLYVIGQGDPTLGSDRWKSTSEETVLKKIADILQQQNVKSVAGDIVGDDRYFSFDALPGGWVWEDIGNYYGAGVWGINWRENQYDVTFKTGTTENDATTISTTKPVIILKDYSFINFVKTGAKGSGDNGWLFSAPFSKNIIAKGTVPVSAEGFTISGSLPNPPKLFLETARDYLKEKGISVSGNILSFSEQRMNNKIVVIPTGTQLDSIQSPTLDSINYWFLKKSVNLFGEALVKMMAAKKYTNGTTDSGISIIRDLWSKRGIEKSALNIIDGSGLSPANRVTTASLVTILQYAQKQKWYASFYNALPLTNGIKMKDGYISGVRSYAGYVKSNEGTEYIFSFIVNNFDGSPSVAREKIWKLLDVLK